MLLFFMPLIITLSLMFTRVKHPLSTGMTLLVQTTLMALYSGSMNHTFWNSYIMFLIFLGAMLILFIYVASLASNEKFSFNMKMLLLFFLTWASTSIFSYFVLWTTMLQSVKIEPSYISNLNLESINQMMTSSLYEIPNFQFTIFIISYLLLTLLIIVKIMNMKKLPLRTFF
uniref:NADH dehydrogenase subunit 6 n=1 Tax=Pisidia serratifrons TaxID=761937 RepID=UPI00226CDA31|nr:NADH dehydrogenase subunit 6 [Pisidia serratifrons]UZA47090.1 NADH dehydrogenase subunit 6 [Pisidia serratifrons]